MSADWLAQALRDHKRIAIAGGPRVGKTTLCKRIVDRPIIHTDDFLKRPWEEVPHLVIAMALGLDSFVVEGVQVPRTLRKDLTVDAVIWLDQPLVDTTAGQRAMARGVLTVFQEWRSSHGNVPIIIPPPRQAKDAIAPGQDVWPTITRAGAVARPRKNA